MPLLRHPSFDVNHFRNLNFYYGRKEETFYWVQQEVIQIYVSGQSKYMIYGTGPATTKDKH